jgi:hypothetical protein
LILLYNIVLISISSCIQNKGKISIKQTRDKNFPLVIDTFGITFYQKNFAENKKLSFKEANYQIYYIGKLTDSIYISPYYIDPPKPATTLHTSIDNKESSPFNNYLIPFYLKNNYLKKDSIQLEILIDTAVIFPNLFAVILKNTNKDTAEICLNTKLPFVMQQLVTNSLWKDIQGENSYLFCGVGLHNLILPPNECILTLAPIYFGKKKVQLRLKFGKNYSKAFEGSLYY